MRRWSLVVLVGCGGGVDPLDEVENIASWANAGSSLGAFEAVREPVAFFDDAFDFQDPTCPSRTKDAAGATITGGDCVDADGHTWTGTAIVTLDGTSLRVDLDEFGNDAFLGPVRTSGFAIIEELGPDEHAFELDVTSRGGVTTTVLYEGTVAGGYTGRTTWNGRGSVRKDGELFDGGTINVETVDQVRDNDACAAESLSGTTTMTSTEHVVVITYDGATDCDPDHAARWSRDGADQGTIAGITCSTGGASGFGALLVVLGVVLRRKPAATRTTK